MQVYAYSYVAYLVRVLISYYVVYYGYFQLNAYVNFQSQKLFQLHEILFFICRMH